MTQFLGPCQKFQIYFSELFVLAPKEQRLRQASFHLFYRAFRYFYRTEPKGKSVSSEALQYTTDFEHLSKFLGKSLGASKSIGTCPAAQAV